MILPSSISTLKAMKHSCRACSFCSSCSCTTVRQESKGMKPRRCSYHAIAFPPTTSSAQRNCVHVAVLLFEVDVAAEQREIEELAETEGWGMTASARNVEVTAEKRDGQ